MDIIDEHLATAALDDRYSPSIKAAVAVGKKLLNKYYDKTDHSELYRIAMSTLLHTLPCLNLLLICISVLHPSHKLSYFRTASWDDEWIAAAEGIVRTEYERVYASEAIDAEEHEDEQPVCYS
jgi:hypothetical protein